MTPMRNRSRPCTVAGQSFRQEGSFRSAISALPPEPGRVGAVGSVQVGQEHEIAGRGEQLRRDRRAGFPAEPRFLGEKRADLQLVLLGRSEEHTSELQSQSNLVCRLLLEKKK